MHASALTCQPAAWILMKKIWAALQSHLLSCPSTHTFNAAWCLQMAGVRTKGGRGGKAVREALFFISAQTKTTLHIYLMMNFFLLLKYKMQTTKAAVFFSFFLTKSTLPLATEDILKFHFFCSVTINITSRRYRLCPIWQWTGQQLIVICVSICLSVFVTHCSSGSAAQRCKDTIEKINTQAQTHTDMHMQQSKSTTM